MSERATERERLRTTDEIVYETTLNFLNQRVDHHRRMADMMKEPFKGDHQELAKAFQVEADRLRSPSDRAGDVDAYDYETHVSQWAAGDIARMLERFADADFDHGFHAVLSEAARRLRSPSDRGGDEHVTAIKSDETGRWVRIPDGVDGVRAYQLLRAASTDAPSEERPDDLSNCRCGPLKPVGSHIRACPLSDRAPTDEAPERERLMEEGLDAAIDYIEFLERKIADLTEAAFGERRFDEIPNVWGRLLGRVRPEPASEGEGEPDGDE